MLLKEEDGVQDMKDKLAVQRSIVDELLNAKIEQET